MGIDDMILRRRLPQRRGAIAVELEHAGHQFRTDRVLPGWRLGRGIPRRHQAELDAGCVRG